MRPILPRPTTRRKRRCVPDQQGMVDLTDADFHQRWEEMAWW